MSEVSLIGSDLARQVFHTHGPDASGQVVMREHFRRGQSPKDWRCQKGRFGRWE